jgi:Cys-rich four helix bundle protein (predicted Tat secretion target)
MDRRRHIFSIVAMVTGTAMGQKKAGLSAAALARTANECVSTGEVCLAHCLDMMASGNGSMAACAKVVNELMAICTALEKLAVQNAPSLARQAVVALDACKRCEAQCRKFAAMPQCKACADACAACAAECAKA